jgi:hypothetical protein
MKPLLFSLSLLLLIATQWGCQTTDSGKNTASPAEMEKPVMPLAFAWPFLEPEMMVSRGGTSQGSQVTLATEPDPRWLALQESGLKTIDRDRLAILAMAGDYRTSFQFTETAGFVDGYAPPQPYFSWGTEHVQVIEAKPRFISLQHTLVMYFEDESGKVMGPMVMKHWRQDWTYEDSDLHTYQGNHIWARERFPQNEITGTWTQSVFQVDDSPRYEVVGTWNHGTNFSTWVSNTSLRPLPRREYSVRNDYNILEGEHRITIVPTGWVHEQHNRKVSRDNGEDTYRAQEIGVNRYERITDPDLSAAEETWKIVGPYWEAVRNTWTEIFKTYDRFQLKSEYSGMKLWEAHFSHAGEIEEAGTYDPTKWEPVIKETILNFLNLSDEKMTQGKY